MTVSAITDPSRLRRQAAPNPTARPPIAVTVHLMFSDDVADPAAALRALVERLGAIGDFAVDAEAAVDDDTVRLDARSRTVRVGWRDVALCRREFDLLLYLAEHPGQVFSRTQLLGAVWGDIFTGHRTVDVHIRRLRSKLGGRRPLITTVHGVGYRLAAAAPITVIRVPVPMTVPASHPPAQRGAA
jgi:DNA-binding winged helix-turn-helix (wHTH) protein